MNDQLQEALASLLNTTLQGINAGQHFLSAQLPDVIHQLLVWKMTISLIVFVVGVMILAAVATSLRLYKKPASTDKLDRCGNPVYNQTFLWDKDGDVTASVVPLIIIQAAFFGIGIAAITNLAWL